MAADGGILVAKTTASLMYDGKRVMIRRGVTLARAGHPITKGREDMFEPVTVHYDLDAPVEQATAAPGEKRTVTPPRGRQSKPAAKKPEVDAGKAKDKG